MPKTKIILFTFTALLLVVGTAGCSKLCNSGYEGSRCNQLTTTKFVAKWNAVDSPNLIYTDTILQGTQINDVTLSSSFSGHHFAHIINASVAAQTLTIPVQQPDLDSIFVQGIGLMSDDQKSISFTYQITSGPDSSRLTVNHTGTWTREN